MRPVTAIVGVVVAVLALAGCASAASGGLDTTETPTTAPVTITVVGSPLSSDKSCPASIGFPAYQHTVKPEGTQLTVKDASGTTVSLSSLGAVSKVGSECHWAWDVDLPVPESDFYTLTWGSDSNTFTSTWMGEEDTTIGTAKIETTKADLASGLKVTMTDYLGAWNSN